MDIRIWPWLIMVACLSCYSIQNVYSLRDQQLLTSCTGSNITLDSNHPQETLIYNGSTPCATCSWFVSSPSGTVISAKFVALRIPEGETLKLLNSTDDRTIISVSNICRPIEPTYMISVGISVELESACSGINPETYIEIDFSVFDNLMSVISDDPLRSSGGLFELSASSSSLTLQSTNMSSSTDVIAEFNWYITAPNQEWLRIDVLNVEAGEGVDVCIHDAFVEYGEWVCMTGNLSQTFWYSYGEEVWIEYWAIKTDRPGAGVTINISIADPSILSGQSLVLPACNPRITIGNTTSLKIVTPFFEQSSLNVRYQCRMEFNVDDPHHVLLEYLHYDYRGTMNVYTRESSNVYLADTSNAMIVDTGRPMVSISPNDQLLIDLALTGYSNDGEGIMVNGHACTSVTDSGLLEQGPIPSFGISTTLNVSTSPAAFTTPGFPTLPSGEMNIKWIFDNMQINDKVIKIEFVDFDIGSEATLFIHVAESQQAILQKSGSVLPQTVYSDTRQMTVLLRSDGAASRRGIHFNASITVYPCDSVPCQNGATCINNIHGYTCTCVPGFTGQNCELEIDECASAPCQNGATCIDSMDEYNCTCVHGFTGQNCELEIDPCASEPCQNGATCIHGIDTYNCTCVHGFTGQNCELEIDPCASAPCQNGAACIHIMDGYNCTCVHGFTGQNCELEIEPCASAPCHNGAECINSIDEYYCTCVVGFTGQNCELELVGCSLMPCLNGGTCNADHVCMCLDGFMGPQCEEDIDECLSQPCQNGGSCYNNLPGRFQCECKDAYTGIVCGTKDNNTLVIALSISLSLAFGLITFLVCAIVYRGSKDNHVTTSHDACPNMPNNINQCSSDPQNIELARRSLPLCHSYIDVADVVGAQGVPGNPPEYETIKPKEEHNYTELAPHNAHDYMHLRPNSGANVNDAYRYSIEDEPPAYSRPESLYPYSRVIHKESCSDSEVDCGVNNTEIDMATRPPMARPTSSQNTRTTTCHK